jgi:hypothetical protein
MPILRRFKLEILIDAFFLKIKQHLTWIFASNSITYSSGAEEYALQVQIRELPPLIPLVMIQVTQTT